MLDIKLVKFETQRKPVSEITSSIPAIQRPKDEKTVNAIYGLQVKCYEQNNFYIINGTISIVHVVDNGDYLIDGQHRLAAYNKLMNDYPDRGIFINTDNYTVNDIKDISIIYKYVNTHSENPITKLSIDEYQILKEVDRYSEK